MKNTPEILWALHSQVEPIDWDAVYTAELPRVYNFFLYKVGNREAAQDLTAITFERAWKLRSRYRAAVAALPTWLFGIARNVLREYLRQHRLNGQRLEPIASREEVPSNFDVEKIVQQQQEKECLRKILLELADREQDLIALKYGAGLTNREIARITRLSESNVGSILHRTIQSIRTKWEKNHG